MSKKMFVSQGNYMYSQVNKICLDKDPIEYFSIQGI